MPQQEVIEGRRAPSLAEVAAHGTQGPQLLASGAQVKC
jgi:hypothetical protein